ncbi:hypothetical protein [Microcoleus vaginatus]
MEERRGKKEEGRGKKEEERGKLTVGCAGSRTLDIICRVRRGAAY